MGMLKNVTFMVIGGAAVAGAMHVLTGGESTEMLKNAINDKVLHKGANIVETVTDVAEDLGDVASDIADGVTI